MTEGPTDQLVTLDAEAPEVEPAPGPTDADLVTDATIGAGADVRRTNGRMEFLDALRGLAAMLVVMQHTGEQLSFRYRKFTFIYLRPGEIGVILFFLCSGFIIPASIERYGSVARFWIGRFFRLYPMYWASMAAAFVLDWHFHRYSFQTDSQGRLHSVLVNATMVERMTRSPMWTGAAWSLAYEVVFYLIVTALFVAGVYKHSVRIAAVAMVATLAVATVRIDGYTSISHQGGRGVAWMVGGFVVSLAVLAIAGRMGIGRTIGVAALLALVVPLVANRNDAMWFALLLFAIMFVGSVLYRAVHGDLSWQTALIVAAALCAVTVLTWRRAIIPQADNPGTGAITTWWGESASFLVAFGLFGIGLLLREKRFPWVARELGRVSYSLYLVHPLVIHCVHPVPGNKALTELYWVGGSLAISMVTFRVIEKPFIAIGRKVSARWSRRSPARVALA